MDEKIQRLRSAAKELEAALNDFGPGVDVDVSAMDVSAMVLLRVLYSVRITMRRDPIEVYP